MQTQWRRSQRCVSNNHCVEVANYGDRIGIRNSQGQASLIFTPIAWANFVDALKSDKFVIYPVGVTRSRLAT